MCVLALMPARPVLVGLLAVVMFAVATPVLANPGAATGTPGARELEGWLIIAGAVGVVVLIAWVGSRIGDSR
ncbi:MAG: hypothetical protein K2V38_18020 [Gemmataceae bacterium]|nr:hypothetical protein [Gemmataceae bacterium]